MIIIVLFIFKEIYIAYTCNVPFVYEIENFKLIIATIEIIS